MDDSQLPGFQAWWRASVPGLEVATTMRRLHVTPANTIQAGVHFNGYLSRQCSLAIYYLFAYMSIAGYFSDLWGNELFFPSRRSCSTNHYRSVYASIVQWIATKTGGHRDV